MAFKKAPASAKSSVCRRCEAIEAAETTAVIALQSPRTPKSSVSGKRPEMDVKNNNNNKSTVTTQQQSQQQQQQQNINKKSPQAISVGKKATVTSSQQQTVNKKLQNNKVNNNKINIHVVNNDSVAAAIGCVGATAAAQQPKSNTTAHAQTTALLTLIVSQRFAMPRSSGGAVASGSVSAPHPTTPPRHPSPVGPVCQQPMPILSR